MNIVKALAEAAKYIGKIPPDVRQIVLDLVRSIADGDDHDVVMEKARRAALAAAARRSYRRGPTI